MVFQNSLQKDMMYKSLLSSVVKCSTKINPILAMTRALPRVNFVDKYMIICSYLLFIIQFTLLITIGSSVSFYFLYCLFLVVRMNYY